MEIKKVLSLEKGTLKRKIVLLLVALLIAIPAVVLILKFAFPDADMTMPYSFVYEFKKDDKNKKFDEALNASYDYFVKTSLFEDAEKTKMAKHQAYHGMLTSVMDSLYKDFLNVTIEKGYSDNLKSLENNKKKFDEANAATMRYYDEQLKTYIETGAKDQIKDKTYFFNFDDKVFNSLTHFGAIVNDLIDITNENVPESLKHNSLMKTYREIFKNYNLSVIETFKTLTEDKAVDIGSGFGDMQSFVNQKILKLNATDIYYNDVAVYDKAIESSKKVKLGEITKHLLEGNYPAYLESLSGLEKEDTAAVETKLIGEKI